MYIGAFIEAIPMATPPISLNTTNNVVDSGSILGNPEPQAEIIKSTAAMINDFFLPIALLIRPAGYVLTFSNGLVVYLSGDTGITAEQDTVVRQYYAAKLAVMNIGDTFTNGPNEAAFVVNSLVRPNAVIASHANEVATKSGNVVPGSRTETFIKASKVPVHVPLSGRTMEFDSTAKCMMGC